MEALSYPMVITTGDKRQCGELLTGSLKFLPETDRCCFHLRFLHHRVQYFIAFVRRRGRNICNIADDSHRATAQQVS